MSYSMTVYVSCSYLSPPCVYALLSVSVSLFSINPFVSNLFYRNIFFLLVISPFLAHSNLSLCPSRLRLLLDDAGLLTTQNLVSDV